MSRKILLSSVLSIISLALFADPATGWKVTSGTASYNDSANWVDGEINGVFGSDLVLTGSLTVTFDEDTVLDQGLSFAQDGGSKNKYKVTLKSSSGDKRTLTLKGTFTNAASYSSVEPEATLDFDLGGEMREFNAEKSAILIHGVISNGGVIYTGASDLRFYGANTYEDGFYHRASGSFYVCNAQCFGSGTVYFEGTSKLSGTSTITVSASNPIVIDGPKLYYSGDKSIGLGDGPITIKEPLTVEVNKNTLTLGGPIAADSPCKITAITKTGGGILETKESLPVSAGNDVTLQVNAGSWSFGGGISGEGTLCKSGDGLLQVRASNPDFTGRLVIDAGSVRFMAANSIGSGCKVLINRNGTLVTNTGQECGFAYSAAKMLSGGIVDPSSTGTLGLASDESSLLDLMKAPNIIIAPNGGDFGLGSISAPPTGVYRFGGGGNTLKINAVLSSGCDIDASKGSLKITADQPDFNGTVTMGNSYSFVLGGGVSAPNMTVVAGTYTVGDKNAINGGVVRLGTAAEGEFNSLKKVVLNTSHLTVDAPSSGATTLKIGEVAVGVARQGVSKMTVPANVTLRIGELTRTNGWEMLQVVNSGKVLFETVPALIGEGPVGTVKTPVIPFVRIGTALATYDETNGLRALAEGEYEEYEGGYEGSVTTPGANVVLIGSGTVTLTGPAAVNSLTVGNLVLAGTEENLLTVASGAVATISDGASDLAIPIDFGTRRGYISSVPNKVVKLTGAISGTGGLTLSDLQFGTTSSGMSLGGVGSTYSGDVAVTGYVTISNPSGFFPHGEELSGGVRRLGDLWLIGKLYITTGDCKICSLNGNGTFAPGGSNTSNIIFNNLETDGLFTGTVGEKTSLNFGATKDGPRCQRLTGVFSGKWNCTVKGGGTLQIDGDCNMSAKSSTYHVVIENGVLSGSGSVSSESTCGSIQIKADGVIAPGSVEIPNEPLKLGKNVDLAQGASFRFYIDDTRASQAIIADGYGLTGTATNVPVVIDCKAVHDGSWLLLEADSFGGKTFGENGRAVGPDGTRLIGSRLSVVQVTDETTGAMREQLWFTRKGGLVVVVR